jgi:hypothetical protein
MFKIFEKPVVAPKTVAEAMAGFVTLKDQLIAVVGANVERRGLAIRRIDDAKAYAAEVERTENEAIAAASEEIRKAEHAEAMINNLLGVPAQPVSAEA